MRRVLVESPYAAPGADPSAIATNRTYARRALNDCLMRGETPFASHLLYTQPGVLDDAKPHERLLGIAAGLAWGEAAHATVVYTDRGISAGMSMGIDAAIAAGRPVEYRSLWR